MDKLDTETLIKDLKKEVKILLDEKNEIENFKKMKYGEFFTKMPKKECENSLYVFAKKIAKFLIAIGFSKLVNYILINYPIHKTYAIYSITDLCQFSDSEFIQNSYRVILNRDASSKEYEYYLDKLRAGILSKTEIIISLHFSKEGRQNPIKILGSKKRAIAVFAYKIPYIGYLVKTIFLFFTLPRLLQRMLSFENFVVVTKADKDKVLELMQKIEFLEEKLNTKVLYLKNKVEALEENITKLENFPNELEFFAEDYFAVAQKNGFFEINHQVKNGEAYYSLFENVFYLHTIVKEKQKVYLKYITDCKVAYKKHLDIGCGRGEFLENLRNINISAVGIDINSIQIENLLAQNYNVEEIDLIDYLKSSTELFSSISALQVIEHLDYPNLKEFLYLAYTKLQENGIIILETINPHTRFAFHSFYMDETHKKPLPPEMMAFLLQWIGFKDIIFVFTSLLPIEYRSTDPYKNYHDYAVIGVKK